MGTEILWMVPADKMAQFHSMGDVNGDGVINEMDMALIQAAYGKRSSSPQWNTPMNMPQDNPLGTTILYSSCDLNGDGVVDIKDLSICARNQGMDVFTFMGWPSQGTIEWSIVGGVLATIAAVGGAAWWIMTHPV